MRREKRSVRWLTVSFRHDVVDIIFLSIAVLRRLGEEILKTIKITKPGEKGGGQPSKSADTQNKPVP